MEVAMSRTGERAIEQDGMKRPRQGPLGDIRPDPHGPDPRTKGGQPQEDVADRPNVSSVSAEDYPDKAGGTEA